MVPPPFLTLERFLDGHNVNIGQSFRSPQERCFCEKSRGILVTGLFPGRKS